MRDIVEVVPQQPYTEEQITAAVRQALQPLRIYDVSIDQWRPATQADLDRLSQIAQEWGRVVEQVRRAYEAMHKKAL